MGDIIEADGVESGFGGLLRKTAQIFPDPGEQIGPWPGFEFLEVAPRDFRPVDPDAVVAPEERADGIDEIERFQNGSGD